METKNLGNLFNQKTFAGECQRNRQSGKRVQQWKHVANFSNLLFEKSSSVFERKKSNFKTWNFWNSNSNILKNGNNLNSGTRCSETIFLLLFTPNPKESGGLQTRDREIPEKKSRKVGKKYRFLAQEKRPNSKHRNCSIIQSKDNIVCLNEKSSIGASSALLTYAGIERKWNGYGEETSSLLC